MKPRPSFWNELNLFMESYAESYKCEGQAIEKLGRELGLDQAKIQAVRLDADKADKVAMNVWRMLCPTRSDRLYVESIKRVPTTTLEKIYSKTPSLSRVHLDFEIFTDLRKTFN